MVLPPAAVVVMPCAGMIFVEVTVQVPQGTMKGAVLGFAIEAVFMGALVGFVYFPVEAVVLPVVVVVIVSRGRNGSCGQRQCRGRHYGFRHGHGRSPSLQLLSAAHGERYPCRSERPRKALFIQGLGS